MSHKGAIACYQEAIRLDKDFAEAHKKLGFALRMKGVMDKLPSILKGEARPADAADCLALAQLCEQPYQRRFVASARFYGEAFVAEPTLADDLASGYRYGAACAAALAGCGAGEDAAKLTDAERASLRTQALDWLRADLDAWQALIGKDPANAPLSPAEVLGHWLGDTDFNGVRGPDALAKLPESERPAWQKLWQHVEALRQRAAAPQDKPADAAPQKTISRVPVPTSQGRREAAPALSFPP